MINKIINWFKSLFHKVPDEILELKEIIAKVEKEKQQLQDDLEKLLSRKRINKKTVANAKRKLTRTKNEIKKIITNMMETCNLHSFFMESITKLSDLDETLSTFS